MNKNKAYNQLLASLLVSQMSSREDQILIKELTKHYTKSNSFENPAHIKNMANDFQTDQMEALSWIVNNSLPHKHFEKAKKILKRRE